MAGAADAVPTANARVRPAEALEMVFRFMSLDPCWFSAGTSDDGNYTT
jgi:hypothetical protein